MSVHPAQALLSSFSDEGATDVTCHIGSWPFRLGAAATVADLRSYAARHGLRRLWVSHFACLFGFDTRTGNEEVLSACGGDDLFRVFAVVNPLETTWHTEMDWALAQGAAGVRTAPSTLGHPLAAAIPLARACRERDVPLQVLIRLDDARVRHRLNPLDDPTPHDVAEFLRETAGTRIVISGLRWEERSEVAMHLADGVPADVAFDLWHVNGPFRVADQLAADPHRWVFGSGFPVQTPQATMLQLAASDLDAGVRRAITVDNAAAVLGDAARSDR